MNRSFCVEVKKLHCYPDQRILPVPLDFNQLGTQTLYIKYRSHARNGNFFAVMVKTLYSGNENIGEESLVIPAGGMCSNPLPNK